MNAKIPIASLALPLSHKKEEVKRKKKSRPF